MNAPANFSGALDPICALHIEAFDALIERRLADETRINGTHAALRLLQHLTDDGPGQLLPYPGPGTARRLRMFQIETPNTTASAYAILRKWQAAARDRLAEPAYG